VVADNKHESLKGINRPTVYLPYSADIPPSSLLARAAGDPLKIVKAVRTRIASVDIRVRRFRPSPRADCRGNADGICGRFL
jgi:hypothetical protein